MPAADGTHPAAQPKRWDASGDQTELTVSAGGHVGEAKIELGYEYQPCPDLEPGGVTRSNSSRLKPPGAQVRVPAVPARTRAGPRAPAGGGGSRCCAPATPPTQLYRPGCFVWAGVLSWGSGGLGRAAIPRIPAGSRRYSRPRVGGGDWLLLWYHAPESARWPWPLGGPARAAAAQLGGREESGPRVQVCVCRSATRRGPTCLRAQRC